MLITLREILNWATENHCAVGAFNTPNLESLQAVLDAAEKLNTPVIISHAQVHEPAMPLKEIGPYMVEAAKKASVPVCVHLDHCENAALCPGKILLLIAHGVTPKSLCKPSRFRI